MHLPLNALRAFEVAARHLSFTHAADELNVTQTAVSMQVKNLEDRMGVTLFRRLPRGLALTDEGLALLPVLAESFERISTVLGQFENGRLREVLTVGVVGTFAVGWLMPIASIWPVKGSITPSASVTVLGMAPMLSTCLLRRWRPCAPPPLPTVCATHKTWLAKPCCALIAPMNGSNGLLPPRRLARPSVVLFSILR